MQEGQPPEEIDGCGVRKAPSIGDFAFEYGFPETGRSAAYYRALFGETPSKTLLSRSVNGASDDDCCLELAQTASRVFHALWLTTFFADRGRQVDHRSK